MRLVIVFFMFIGPIAIADMTDKERLEIVKKLSGTDRIYNPEAPIPAQCYTKTDGVNNPCFICHQTYDASEQRPNVQNDGFFQGTYVFSDVGVSNSWQNLFVDRREKARAITDEAIDAWIDDDNYERFIKFVESDAWPGPEPVIRNLALGKQAFDKQGVALDGSRWVAFNYKPMPSTFWPTNGATDDVMIRLPEAFSSIDGSYSRDVYFVNLGLLELAISDRAETTIPPVDEMVLRIDIDGNGELQPDVGRLLRRERYVGDASETSLASMLYPAGTQFVHTVRYVDLDEQGHARPSRRIKEVRYMNKVAFLSRSVLASSYYLEKKEKNFEKLPRVIDKGRNGLSNHRGWTILGFIEDEHGELRKQSREEQFFCVGCHKSIGSTIDQTFSFPRKVAGADGWGYIDLTDITDIPNIGEEDGEYLTYMSRVGGGDEFRQNQEMLDRWFDENGSVNRRVVEKAPHIAALISPSRARARALNKSYLSVVREQSYIMGRDVVLSPATNVFREIDEDIWPLKREHRFIWDIRLNWGAGAQLESHTGR